MLDMLEVEVVLLRSSLLTGDGIWNFLFPGKSKSALMYGNHFCASSMELRVTVCSGEVLEREWRPTT